MQHDALIVGFGLAGCALTEVLKQEGKSFVPFDAEKKSSSSVATGIYNPLVLKRFTAISYAQELMDFSIPYYANAATFNTPCRYTVCLPKPPNKTIGWRR